MRLSRVWGVCVLVALVVGAISASSALAAHEPPEWGRCVKVEAGKTGAYTGPTCLKLAKGTQIGKYEWVPPSAIEKLGFTATGGETTLTALGHPTVKCIAANFTGEYTGAKTASVSIEFQGCTDQNGKQCQSPPGQNKSEIKAMNLEANLGYTRFEEVEGKKRIAVGLDLKAMPPLTSLATYECTESGETAMLEGSVIGKLKPLNKMTTETDLAIKTRFGVQEPESFVGGEKDTLSTTFMKGLETVGTVPSTLNILNEKGVNSALFEVKAQES
jgi:hypothetical protein